MIPIMFNRGVTRERSLFLSMFLVFCMVMAGCGGSGSGISCIDADGDWRGEGDGCLGTDCRDDDRTCWEGACCPACLDSMDNDGDGWVDVEDPDCASGDAEVGFGATECNDGVDNDGDLLIDRQDNGCIDALDGEACVEEGASSGVTPGAAECCPGLVSVGCDAEDSRGGCNVCSGASFCTNCGDGTCGPGENACRCPADCP